MPRRVNAHQGQNLRGFLIPTLVVTLVVFLFVCTGRVGRSIAADSPLTPAGEQSPLSIERAIDQLNDRNFKNREAATHYLWKMGDRARLALEKALDHESFEVKNRATLVLTKFRWGIYPDTPEPVLKLIHQYRKNAGHIRRTVVSKLLNSGMPGIRALLRIGQHENDAPLRRIIFDGLRREASRVVPVMLADGRDDEASQLISGAAQSGTETSMRHYAAYLAIRGGLAERIKDLSRIQSPTENQLRLLAYLNRASGNLQAAADVASRTDDHDLRRGIRYELGDWKRLAEIDADPVIDRMENGIRVTGIEELGFATAYLRLADRPKEAESVLEVMTQLGQANVWYIAEAMMLNDRFPQAIESFSNAGKTLEAFKLLVAQSRFREAFELAEKAQIENAEQQFDLMLEVAKARGMLGQKDQSLAVFRQLIAVDHDWSKPARVVALVDALRDAGFEAETEALSIQALAKLERSNQHGQVLGELLGQNKIEQAAVWWDYWRRRLPDVEVSVVLIKVRSVLSGKMPADEYRKLLSNFAGESGKLPNGTRARWLAAAAEAWFDRGQTEMAISYLERSLELFTDPERTRRLGEMFFADNRWADAAELYLKLWEKNASDYSALYRSGYALDKAGDKDGQSRMALALLLPLGDDAGRHRLAETLETLGQNDLAHRQRRLISRTAPFGSWYVGSAITRSLLPKAMAEGRFAEAEVLAERYRLACLRTSTALLHVEHHLLLAIRVREAATRKAIQQGDLPTAYRQAVLASQTRPSAIEVVIDAIIAMDKANKRDLGDKLFHDVFGPAKALCHAFPKSAIHHNRAAWLAGRCLRELDLARQLASAAVELQPKNAAFVDTLAEVHFQRGEREQAVALARRCILLEPDDPFFKKQLKRFSAE